MPPNGSATSSPPEHIAPGDVDERSIADVRPDDLRSYTQAHFFAGIGGWSVALRLAGWPDDRPVWTGSCPCQPFSAAGKGEAADDERHLWPAWLPLIAERRPAIVFGEQVEAAIGWGWLDAVFADLEGEGYACGATVLPACGVGAPHIRQRMWFVADADQGRGGRYARAIPGTQGEAERGLRGVADGAEPCGPTSDMADAAGGGFGEQRDASQPRRSGHADGGVVACELGDTSGSGLQERERDGRIQREAMGAFEGQAAVGGSNLGGLEHAAGEQVGLPGRARVARATPWSALDWLPCTDGKARPVEPGTFPLAHGIPGRVGRLRAYGNAIVPQTAAEFIIAASGIA